MKKTKVALKILVLLVTVGIVAPLVAYKLACYWAFQKIAADVTYDLKALQIDSFCSSRSVRDSIAQENKGFYSSSPKRAFWNTFVKRDPDVYKSNNYAIYSSVSRWYAFKAQEKEERWGIAKWHLIAALISVSFETKLKKDEMISLECFCYSKSYK